MKEKNRKWKGGVSTYNKESQNGFIIWGDNTANIPIKSNIYTD